MPVLVFGHRNPDTDAICSAIGYADFLRRTRYPDAEPARCGDLNVRTQFALERAGVPPPRLVLDVRPTLAEIARAQAVLAREDETLLEVFRRMQRHRVRAIPVLDATDRFVGLVSFSRLMEQVLPDTADPGASRVVETSLERVRRTLEGSFQHAVEADTLRPLVLMVAAMSKEAFLQRLHARPPGELLVVVGDRPSVQKAAVAYGVRGIVVTGGYTLAEPLLEEARQRGVSVLNSPQDTASTTLLIRTSRPILRAIDTGVVRYPGQAHVSRIRREIQGVAQDLFPILDEAGLLQGVFSKSDLVDPRPGRLVLVDHNELTQAVHGAEEAEILEVVDHHRLGGGLQSKHPIRFINEPVGSTSTIVAHMYRQTGLECPRGVGMCLIAGMVSDTLNLTSPTTTPLDREVLAWLAERCGVDVAAYTRDFFAAGSVLESKSPEEAVSLDCKDYHEGPWRFAVAQIEELGLERFWSHRDGLQQALDNLCRLRGLDFAALLVTDITCHFSLLLLAGDRRVRAAVDYPEQAEGLFALDGVVSRKKQLLPHLTSLLAGIER
jgi:manganese-dependent inorganic pyrophosphatase